jgi:predicted alpha/beta superfamily hydrolase
MQISHLSFGRYTASLFSPDGAGPCPVVYTHLPAADAEAVAALQGDTRFVLVAVDGVDWNADLSPWPAPKVFSQQEDFAGGADAYVKDLEGMVPAVEARLGFTPTSRFIAGYSLAGLFAVYALYRISLFTRVASMSSALWYDGFLEFLKTHRPLASLEKAYFSLGDREKKTRNPRLAAVEDCTVAAENVFRSQGIPTVLEFHPGNHFADVTKRMAQGIRWIARG